MSALSRVRLHLPPKNFLQPLLQHVRRSSTFTSEAAVKTTPITSLLIANRGEIALRVGRTASEHGIRTTTLYTDPDAHSQHAHSSPFAINLGAPSGYLDGDRIIQLAKDHGCQAIHPGYGFLSENPTFARKCIENGLTFVGPPYRAIEDMGSKSRSKEIMIEAGVPCIPGYHGKEQDPTYLKEQAANVGYPVLLKAVKGGGGKGMRIVNTPDEFEQQLESAMTEARNSFGDDVMLVEKYITKPRHIEVQVFADKHGNCVALGERDCSIQRRHQKILEESPAPHLDDAIRKDLWGKARAAALAVGYEGAGTVEFIFDNDTAEFFFMEMNTRLQVEHPVTEMVTGQDLVHWQLIVAQGGKLPLTQEQIEEEISHRGHAIEARIYAENPDTNFMPDSGTLLHLKAPTTSDTVRIDAGFVAGDEVSSHYDPMIAKLIVRGEDRQSALQKMRAALEQYEIGGMVTNIEFLKRICASPAFMAGEVETGYIQKYHDELFATQSVPPEALAQAAIGLFLEERQKTLRLLPDALSSSRLGSTFQTRSWTLAERSTDPQVKPEPINVSIREISEDKLEIVVSDKTYPITIAPSSTPTSYTAYYPHTRLSTTLLTTSSSAGTPNRELTLWQQGQQFRFSLLPPPWLSMALGTKDITHSVLAPMPCKVLKVDVKAGDEVKKDQVLVVIESMKMETVIRSPKDGVVKRIVHEEGEMCKAGTALVEFEE